MKLGMGLVMSALVALAACGQKTEVASTGSTPPDAKPSPQIVPAIIPPDEVADPTEPPSYEVSLASAAANRNTALARCLNQPAAVRTECEQEANAAFAEVETKLQDLRGNTE
jgi:hypothetical protein